MTADIKLTETQQKVYDLLIEKANKGYVNALGRLNTMEQLEMNPVSFGLIVKALADKELITVEKDKSINIPLTALKKASTPVKKEEPLKASPKSPAHELVASIKKNNSSIYTFKPEDYDVNMFADLKTIGAGFDPKKYVFFSQEQAVIEQMQAIIEFYTSSNDTFSTSQRKLRDEVIEKFNQDMICKKYNGKLVFINTNDLGDTKAIIAHIKKNNRKAAQKGNKIYVEVA